MTELGNRIAKIWKMEGCKGIHAPMTYNKSMETCVFSPELKTQMKAEPFCLIRDNWNSGVPLEERRYMRRDIVKWLCLDVQFM